MKLLILAVGHKMPSWITEGFNEYSKRMPREAKIELVEIKPEPRTTGKSVSQIMEAEAQRLQAALPRDVLRIVLDERGAHWTTRQLTQHMQDWLGGGRANQLLALSAMVLPHGMVRVLLAEQLYRAHSLLHNHPYHRE